MHAGLLPRKHWPWIALLYLLAREANTTSCSSPPHHTHPTPHPRTLNHSTSTMADSSASAPADDPTLLNRWKAAGGFFEQYTHQSSSTQTPMRFTIFLPPQATSKPVPILYYLSGLTCTDENVVQKGFVQFQAAKRGLAIVCPDTSPRGAGVEGEDEGWDFGTGAGFYVDATTEKWKK